MTGTIELEESCFQQLEKVGIGQHILTLDNNGTQPADGTILADWFSRVPGIQSIDTLVLGPDSRLRDLTVLRGLPNLTKLQINSLNIKSFDGLNWFTKGRAILIDTGRNKKRDIAKIASISLTKLCLYYAHESDFEAISGNSALQNLEIGASPHPPFENWKHLPLRSLSLSKAKFGQLTGTAQLPNLKELSILGSRKLETFAGDHSGISWLLIDGCRNLDVSTLNTFSNLETLTIVESGRPVKISELKGHKQLKSLYLDRCQIDVDDMRDVLPNLHSLDLNHLKKKQAIELSLANPNISISTDEETYLNGKLTT